MQAAIDQILSQLSEAHNEVMGALPIPSYEEMTEGPGVISGLKAFAAAINWDEPFFLYLGGFHVAFLLFCFIWSRNSSNRTAVCLGITILLGLALPYLNDLGAQYHDTIFIKEKNINYFDEHGTFLSAVFGAPIVVMALLLQIKLLYYVAVMMIKLKREQIKHQMKKSSGDKKGEVAADTSAAKETAKTK